MTTIKTPKRVCLYNDADRKHSLSFLNLIDNTILGGRGEVVVDFSELEYLGAAASVRLFAIINRAYFVTKRSNVVRFIWPKKEKNPSGHRYIVGTGLSIALMANNTQKLEKLCLDQRYYQSAVEPFD